MLYNIKGNQELNRYSVEFDKITSELNDNHILHHYGDETIIENHGSINVGKFNVGKCSYSSVLLPNIRNLKSNTVKMLLEFSSCGGKIYSLGASPEFEEGRKTEGIAKLSERIISCSSINELKLLESKISPLELHCNNPSALHLSFKECEDGRKLVYIINNEKEEQKATLEISGEYNASIYNVVSSVEKEITSVINEGKTVINVNLSYMGSALIYLKQAQKTNTIAEEHNQYIALDKQFDVSYCTENAITLDKCIYRVDGGDWQPQIAVINLFNELLSLQKECDVEMQFEFSIAEAFNFSTVSLCMENPEKFKIAINGNKFNFQDKGAFLDHAFRKSNIGDFLKIGKNTINLSVKFNQSADLYYAKFTPGVHESVLNKLTYDTELESIYIIGDFGVEMSGEYVLGERRCIHGGKNFSLVKRKETIDITDITRQGFWFFSGIMELAQNVNIQRERNKQYFIAFKQLNAPAAQIIVNGEFAGNMMFAPYIVDVTDFINDGNNEIIIRMLSGNRNLLGPHHRPYGESYYVGPDTFSSKNGWSDDPNLPPWTDNYNFVLFGAAL